jgi:hypothetical protein
MTTKAKDEPSKPQVVTTTQPGASERRETVTKSDVVTGPGTMVDLGPKDDPPVEHAPVKARKVTDGMCAADDGTPHYGDGTAIPGTQVCSAHEIHFFRDGSPRANPDGTRRA